MEVSMIRGASDSKVAEVDRNSLRVRPYGEWEQAVADGEAFSWSNATYDYAANDTILGVENNSTTKDLVIKRIFIHGDTATQFVVHTSSGATMAGTAVTGVNLNRNSSNTADATAKGDETGNGQQAASYTGRWLTGRIAANGHVDVPIDGALILPNDHNVGVDFTTDGAAANITIWGYFVTREDS